ncbi:hypothetical protein [Methylocaldum sp.]|uniref:hypothetical protein n=1 Tax=Methylocaldum sp. TaxID=1969727 RepID=UPI002D3B079B|nr:hypothetical protein [Methylocaldum sp.]HYE38135.1 hypothetical protein [Methylocaldum sp.]
MDIKAEILAAAAEAELAPQCYITGCALYLSTRTCCAWGDLFIFGDMYIFNASTYKEEAILSYHSPETHREQRCLIVHGNDYFERRGVFVINKRDAELNAIAKMYKGIEE